MQKTGRKYRPSCVVPWYDGHVLCHCDPVPRWTVEPSEIRTAFRNSRALFNASV